MKGAPMRSTERKKEKLEKKPSWPKWGKLTLTAKRGWGKNINARPKGKPEMTDTIGLGCRGNKKQNGKNFAKTSPNKTKRCDERRGGAGLRSKKKYQGGRRTRSG